MLDVTAGQSAPVGGVVVDQERLTLLFVIYNERLVRTLRGRLGSRWELAEDIAQETWAKVVQKLDTCRASDDRAFPWIAVIARRAASDYFRLARNTRELPTDFGAEGPVGLAPAFGSPVEVDVHEQVALDRLTAFIRGEMEVAA
ncbi:sigma factor [Streptomyces xanthochromogenes]|uniref:RNA polymerase sigma factor n=1 Tax=Streptomyces xanthochromogenes TaxID=67384 RepID=UPI003433E372